MSFLSFLKDKIILILGNLIISIFIILLLSVIKTPAYVIFVVIFLIFLVAISSMILEYLKKQYFYKNVNDNLNNLDKKFLINELINMPEFSEGEVFVETLQQITKSMNDEIAKYNRLNQEYEEYIEMWVHEIKTPIASSLLIVENNKNEITKSIEEEVNKISEYVDQALFYSKSNSVEKDYIIKEANLKELVNKVIKKNAKTLIQQKTKLEFNGLDVTVYTDTKWLEFIINQIISNSIKYNDKLDKNIKIEAEKNEHNVILKIRDNGIGIDERDILKVFEKGFTGENGRKFTKSTGIGLYLCHKLCEKLGNNISIDSKVNNGTTVTLIFPISKLIAMES